MHVMKIKWKQAMERLAIVLLVAMLVPACKSEARRDCERNAESLGASKAPCRNL